MSGADEPTGFLYPFIEAEERDTGSLLTDLAASARGKIDQSRRVQAETLGSCADELDRAATAIAERIAAGGRLFTFGNGGSSTDAEMTADLFCNPPAAQANGWPTPQPAGPPSAGDDETIPTAAAPSAADDQDRGWPAPPPVGLATAAGDPPPPRASRPRPMAASCLVADRAVLTALANDVGFELVFSRQLIAHARPGDVAIGFSTSGGSANVLRAFAEARRRQLVTVGFAGYDGGEMAASDDVDHCLVVRSDSVHRIQEAQDALVFDLWARVQRCSVGRT